MLRLQLILIFHFPPCPLECVSRRGGKCLERGGKGKEKGLRCFPRLMRSENGQMTDTHPEPWPRGGHLLGVPLDVAHHGAPPAVGHHLPVHLVPAHQAVDEEVRHLRAQGDDLLQQIPGRGGWSGGAGVLIPGWSPAKVMQTWHAHTNHPSRMHL